MGILSLEKVTKSFGGIRANDEVTFSILEGEILGIIGHNGAGKTTLFNVITGRPKPDTGSIIFKGEDITGLTSAKVAAKGISRTFQISTLFNKMTVYQNINVAHYLFIRKAFWKYILNTRSVQNKEKDIHQRTERAIDFFGLHALRDELAENLPYGYQRALGISIAMASEPKLLLLDEPVVGMNETETAEMIDHIRRIRDMGITIVMIEHDMKALMSVSDRVVALGAGRKIAEGTPAEIQNNKAVIESYLGKEEDF